MADAQVNAAQPEAKGTGKVKARDRFPIEELARRQRVPAWALAGTTRAYGWRAGQELSEREFTQKLRDWMSGPARR